MKKKLLFIAITLLAAFFGWFFLIHMPKMNSEVLDAFEIMNEKFEKSNVSAQKKLDSLQHQVGFATYAEKLKTLDKVSDDLSNHIDYIKQELTTKVEDPTDYSKMDKSSQSDAFFFSGNGYSPEGHEFVAKIEAYKNEVKALFKDDFPEIVEQIDSKFNDRDTIDDWLEYNYKDFPLVAVLTKLTQMQSDIKYAKEEIIVKILEIKSH